MFIYIFNLISPALSRLRSITSQRLDPFHIGKELILTSQRIDGAIEKRISDAIDAISDREKLNVKQVAREFGNVPYRRLLERLKGRRSRSTRSPAGPRLDEAQEAALRRHIDFLDEFGVTPKYKQISAAANLILCEHHKPTDGPRPKVGAHWLKRFLKRHPEYFRRHRRATDLERQLRLTGVLLCGGLRTTKRLSGNMACVRRMSTTLTRLASKLASVAISGLSHESLGRRSLAEAIQIANQ